MSVPSAERKHASRRPNGSVHAGPGGLQVFAKVVAQEAFRERLNRAFHLALLLRRPSTKEPFEPLSSGKGLIAPLSAIE